MRKRVEIKFPFQYASVQNHLVDIFHIKSGFVIYNAVTGSDCIGND